VQAALPGGIIQEMMTYRIARATPPRLEWVVVPTSSSDGPAIQTFETEADAQAVADRLNAIEDKLDDCA
jgi:hypothetical protein